MESFELTQLSGGDLETGLWDHRGQTVNFLIAESHKGEGPEKVLCRLITRSGRLCSFNQIAPASWNFVNNMSLSRKQVF